MDTSPGSSTTAAQRGARATPLLTCERCRDRKVKCDKLDPCTNCVVSGVACVAIRRIRLPRGRHVAAPTAASGATMLANEDLRRRIRKLESVIERMSSLREGPSTMGAGGSSSRSHETATTEMALDGLSIDPSSTPGPTTSLLMQGPDDFWAYLVEEMHGLREVVDSAATDMDDEHDDGTGADSATETTLPEPVDSGLALVGLRGPPGTSTVDASTAAKLCQVYLRQVDPIIKILHRPSLSRWLLQGQAYLDYPPAHASTAALRGAVFYIAACSLSENQCRAEFAMRRADLRTACRSQCEAAMEQSDLLTTRDITVLQAFVLYLFARKTHDKSRAVWTLVALAVRIARALRLDQPAPTHPVEPAGGLHPHESESFFCQQVRRQLWATLCLLDIQAAQMQVTQPLIGSEGEPFSFVLPAHIDDSDFGPDTVDPVPDKEGITDTTNAHVTYRIQLLGRGMVSTAGAPSQRDFWQQQAHQFEQQVLGLLHFCDPEASDFAWYTWHGTHSLVSAARLFALRPILTMQRMQTPSGGASPGAAIESAEQTAETTPSQKTISQSLQLVIQALEKVLLILTDPRGEGFRWYITIQSPILVIAVSDCYLCADASLVRRAWPVVEEVYRRYETHVERNHGGLLKRPLSQLMCRTRDRVVSLSGEDGGGIGGGDGMNPPSAMPNTPLTSLALPPTTTYTPSLSSTAGLSDGDPLIGQNLWNDSREDMLSGVSFDDLGNLGDLGSPGMYFL